MSLYDYSRWPDFTKDELICKHTGLENPNVDVFGTLMGRVQYIRDLMGVPFIVTSAYRHPTHPIEARKAAPGQHTIAAIDINLADPNKYYDLVTHAIRLQLYGIGINLKGAYKNRFVHLDMRPYPNRTIWSYS